MSKKILITGANGLVGSALRRFLKGRYDMRLLFHNTVPEVDPGGRGARFRPVRNHHLTDYRSLYNHYHLAQHLAPYSVQ